MENELRHIYHELTNVLMQIDKRRCDLQYANDEDDYNMINVLLLKAEERMEEQLKKLKKLCQENL